MIPMKTKRSLGDKLAPYVMLGTVAAVAIPSVVWALCKATEYPAVKKILESLK